MEKIVEPLEKISQIKYTTFTKFDEKSNLGKKREELNQFAAILAEEINSNLGVIEDHEAEATNNFHDEDAFNQANFKMGEIQSQMRRR